MGTKRPGSSLVLVEESKRQRNDLVSYTKQDKALAEVGVRRTSNLFAPIMLLEGHESEIFTTEFNPDGDMLLSSGFDRKIFIWNVYGECENVLTMSGHKGAVLEAHFSRDGANVFSCSTDNVLSLWDVATGQRVRQMKGHQSFVNSVQGTRRGDGILCSGSDDRNIKIWDARRKYASQTLETTYQVTAVTFNDSGEQVISSGIDNEIKIWDLRKQRVMYTLQGHVDTVTGLSLSPDGAFILSNSMDNTLRVWDIRAYVPGERFIKMFTGHQHNFEKNLLRCAWSPDSTKVSCGSADRFVYVWDTTTRRILYKLPGHNSSVNDVDFHTKEPIILSGSSDKNLYLGEIEY